MASVRAWSSGIVCVWPAVPRALPVIEPLTGVPPLGVTAAVKLSVDDVLECRCTTRRLADCRIDPAGMAALGANPVAVSVVESLVLVDFQFAVAPSTAASAAGVAVAP